MVERSERYLPNLPEDISAFREFLEDYSHVPSEEVGPHLHKMRDHAWALAEYPCIGRWGFTRIQMFVADPRYELAVSRLTSPGSADAILDVGCGLGQNTRQLAHAGVPGSKLFATDLHPRFLELGFELFRDRERLSEATFVAGNMLDADDPRLKKMDGKVTIVHATNFFHLFGWEAQVVIGVRLAYFLRPDAEGAFIFGRQVGSLGPGVQSVSYAGQRNLHNQETFQRLWNEVGERTGMKWRVEVDIISKLPRDMAFVGDAARLTRYAVYRV